jgi:hypothetical protein
MQLERSILQFRLLTIRVLPPAQNEAHKVDALCVLGACVRIVHREKFLGHDCDHARVRLSQLDSRRAAKTLFINLCRMQIAFRITRIRSCRLLIAVFIAPRQENGWGESEMRVALAQ